MSNHLQIKVATGLQVYFCDPASPWQRGSNENTNGLLRQYFPKGTDLSQHAPDYLDFVAAQMNRRPRETPSWTRPAEALGRTLDCVQVDRCCDDRMNSPGHWRTKENTTASKLGRGGHRRK